MSTIIAQSGQDACANLDAVARQRADRLARATAEEVEKALAFLSVIDPEAFEIAFSAVAPAADDLPDDEAVPLCRFCCTTVGIFPRHGLGWQHYRGDGTTVGAQEIFDPGHTPEVAWYASDDLRDEF